MKYWYTGGKHNKASEFIAETKYLKPALESILSHLYFLEQVNEELKEENRQLKNSITQIKEEAGCKISLPNSDMRI